MMKKISPLPQSLFFDLNLGADMTDLDNYTYFDTLEELTTNKEFDSW